MKNINIEASSLYNNNKKVHDKVLRRFSAFDGIGMDLTTCSDYDTALRSAGLAYSAEKRPIFLERQKENDKGKKETYYSSIERQYASVKVNESLDEDGEPHVLGIVGEQYNCVSNREAFSVAEELVEEGMARFEVGGPVLGVQDKIDYSKAFMVLRGDDFKVADEPFNSFTILRNSFDGSTGVNFQVICQRVWCQNMATRYLGGKKNQLYINIQHSSSAIERIEQAKKIVMKRQEDIRLIQKEAAAFIDTKFSRKQFEQKIIPLILTEMKLVEKGKERERGQERVERIVNTLLSAYDADDIQNWNGSAYKVILALQDFETHSSPLKDTGNKSVYINRIAKGMLWTTAAANFIASEAGFDMRQFRN